VGTWLSESLPADRPLLLVAPSGGYCLSNSWLSQHRAPIHAVDWDPLAPSLFGRSHPGLRVSWHRLNVMENGGAPLSALLQALPDASIVFCNFLGQAELASPREYPSFAQGLQRTMEGRRWASFHDRFSGPLWPISKGPFDSALSRASSEELTQHFYRQAGELNEHELPALPEGIPYRYWMWELLPGFFHLIEGFAQ